MLQLDCVAQNYAWGIVGNDSMVARFKQASSGAPIVPSQCYAELWSVQLKEFYLSNRPIKINMCIYVVNRMGTHPSGPACVLPDGEPLLDWLTRNCNAVGYVPTDYTPDNLPFLFKVLSVRTALSLQTHPDKALARELHAKFPDIYKDPNHKPEMVIALTPFECMCGFRSLDEIRSHFTLYPELCHVVDHSGNVQMKPHSSFVLESVTATISSWFRRRYKLREHCKQLQSIENIF